ncbi:MAG: copper transporter [Cellulomonadaceae bacterium]|jgi:hypothetical protein|nr:copper transporter [Cellulomonadaceae bacterium]
MIDFRYHLVSLVAVFLALAVGIILGAGPLQGTLGQQLSDQVSGLRDEASSLRGELSTTRANASAQEQFIEAAGPTLVDSTLHGRNVAVVTLGDVNRADATAVSTLLESAGATEVADVDVTQAWTNADSAEVRDTFAGGINEQYAASLGITDETPSTDVLAAALTSMLTSDPAADTENDSLASQLAASGLVNIRGDRTAAADSIIFIAGIPSDLSAPTASPSPAADGQVADPVEDPAVTYAGLARIAGAAVPVVVAAPTTTDGDILHAIANDSVAAGVVSTVSGVETVAGQIQTPLALATRIAGTVDHFGFGRNETVLPPIRRVDPAPEPGSTQPESADTSAQPTD